MAVKIEVENRSDLNTAVVESAIWQQPYFLKDFTPLLNLTAYRGGEITGRWIVPVHHDGNYYRAEREERFLPYAAPQLLDKHPYARRETFYALLQSLMNRVASIQLPMEPGFHDLGCLNELGGFAEARHTYFIDPLTFSVENCLRRARRAICHAGKQTEVKIHTKFELFHFEKAIIASADSVRKRTAFAKLCHQHGKVLIVDALIGGVSYGQLLLVDSGVSWMLMHSWCERNGVHGTANLLIAEACRYLAVSDSEMLLDLEGSILFGVDRFMAGMGKPVTYPMIYWARETTELFSALKDSYLIPKRICSEQKGENSEQLG